MTALPETAAAGTSEIDAAVCFGARRLPLTSVDARRSSVAIGACLLPRLGNSSGSEI